MGGEKGLLELEVHLGEVPLARDQKLPYEMVVVSDGMEVDGLEVRRP